jgi:hypothetical protein
MLLFWLPTGPVNQGTGRAPGIEPPPPIPNPHPFLFEAFLEYRLAGEDASRNVPLSGSQAQHLSLSARDDYRLIVETVQQCYLRLYQADSRGKVWQLFPNTGWTPHVGNPLQGGKSYTLPSDSTWYYLDDVVGEETIYVVASRGELADLDALFEEAGNSSEGAERLLQELSAIQQGGRNDAVCEAFTFEHGPAAAQKSPAAGPAPK